MMLPRTVISLLAIFMGYLFSVQVNAQEPLRILRADGSWPPFEYFDERHEVVGIHIDILNAVSRRTAIPIEITSLPWNRAMKRVRDGDADALLYVRRNPEREKFLHFYEGAVLSQTSRSVIVTAERAGEIDFDGSVRSLEPYTVGMMRGFSNGKKLDTADYLKRDFSDGDEGQMVRKLLDRRIDVALSNELSFLYLAKTMGLEGQLTSLGIVTDIVDVYIAVSRKSSTPLTIERLAKDIPAFKKTAEYQELLKKY